MRIALADRPPKVVGFGFGGYGPKIGTFVRTQEFMTTTIVKEAATRVGGKCEIVDAMLPGDDKPVDALVFRLAEFDPEVLQALWPGVPALALSKGDPGEIVAGVDVLDMSTLTSEQAGTDRIMDWLLSSLSITVGEREMLEALVGTVRRVLDDNCDLRGENYDLRCENAQLRAAVDTLDAQLHAPIPSRNVIKWALGQVDAFVVGILSGEVLPYLPELLHHFL